MRLNGVWRQFYLLLLLWGGNVAVQAATHDLWQDLPSPQVGGAAIELSPKQYRLLALDESQMARALGNPLGGRGSIPQNLNNKLIIHLPLPNGGMLKVHIEHSQVLAPALAKRYPKITTYRMDPLLNRGIAGVLDFTEQGFHAMLFLPNGRRLFIDPRKVNGTRRYLSYYSKDYLPVDKQRMRCSFRHDKHSVLGKRLQRRQLQRSGGELRTYRLAMAATGEYTAYHGGTVTKALGAITTTINRVNAIYERDLAVRLQLVANTDQLIFTDANSDPYSNDDGASMLSENQNKVDEVIGSVNYDIGHVFSTGGGGVAYLGSVCDSAQKAGGVTGSDKPIGDAFDIDYVAHEMGHQFGGNHTFNAETGSCSGGNRNPNTAFEPGSGSTIQAYAGICNPNNIQNNSDAMFHLKSIEEMGQFIDSDGGNTCGAIIVTNNTQPTANAGGDYTIPANTPFELEGQGSDGDGDTLKYSWEQIDSGDSANLGVDKGNNAIFRAFLPTNNSKRTFPRLATLLAGQTDKSELIPQTARRLNFGLVVRDARGGVAIDTMRLDVVDSTGFRITSHTVAQTLDAGVTTELTWDVAATNVVPVSCSQVDISIVNLEGTKETQVLIATINDGSENITVPANINQSTDARFKIKCSNNVFFALSSANLTTTSTVNALPVVLTAAGNNEAADPGESIQFDIPLHNQSAMALTQVSAALSSTVAGVELLAINSTYPNIAANSQASNQTAYRLKVPMQQACGSTLSTQLAVDFTTVTSDRQVVTVDIPIGTISVQRQSNTTQQVIPDNDATGINSTINLSNIGQVAQAGIRVSVDIEHAYRGDLQLDLVSPQGTQVRLKSLDNDDTENLQGTFPTTLTPVDALSVFDGENLDGTWTLKVVDRYSSDEGRLLSWGLHYNTYQCVSLVEDSDNDTVADAVDNCPNVANSSQRNTDGDAQGDACDSDDDNDGMSDIWELKFGFNPLADEDAVADYDQDGLSNLQEFQAQTNPKVADTDNDGMSDGDEVNSGRNPLQADGNTDIQKIMPIILDMLLKNKS